MQDQIIMYPTTQTMIAYAVDRNNYRLPGNLEETQPDIAHYQRLLSDVDSLYEVHDQVGFVVYSTSRNELEFSLF